MIDPGNINSGDKFKVIAKFGLWDLTAYQTRLETQLKANEGWKKKADGNLMTLEELKQAPFEKPTIKDGLSLPPLSSSEERIVELQPGAEITTVQIMYHTGKAASGNASNKDKAFQSLLVSALVNDETKFGFVWTTHADVDHVEQIVPIEEDDPPIEEEEKEEQSFGNEIHVKAGQTTVLEVKAEEGNTATGSGEMILELIDANGEPVSKKVYLSGPGGNFEFSTNENGVGNLKEIPAGSYTISMEKIDGDNAYTDYEDWEEDILFGSNEYRISNSNSAKLDQILDQIVETEGVMEITLTGYSNNIGSKVHNTNLSIQRAAHTRKYIEEKLKIKWKNTDEKIPQIRSTGKGAIEGKTNTELAKNRKVKGKNKVKSFLPPVPKTESCLLKDLERRFIVKDINVVLGENAREKHSAIPNDEIGNNYWEKEATNYNAFVPIGKMEGCFLILTHKLNVYKRSDSLNDLFKQTFDPQFSVVVSLDGEIKYLDIYQIDEGVLDHKGQSNRRRDLEYFEHEIVRKAGESKYSARITRQVYRQGIDPEAPAPTLFADLVLGQVFLIHFGSGKFKFKDLDITYQNYFHAIRKHIAEHEAITKVEIIGHTDVVDTDTFNKNLSLNRAKSIENELINDDSLKKRKTDGKLSIKIDSKGEDEPWIDKSDRISKSYNRRVEIKVHWDFSLLDSKN